MLSKSLQDFIYSIDFFRPSLYWFVPKVKQPELHRTQNSSGNPWLKKRLPALNTSFLEGTQFSRNNLSQSNVVKDTKWKCQGEPKRLWNFFLMEHVAQEKCKTNQPLLLRKTEITSDYGTKWKWKPRITRWFMGVWPYNQSCWQEVKSTNIRLFPEMTQENLL